ncbi:MAG TPA: hypothetical protein VFG14_16350, partial [Chthoniobacteraceae bacterium]|nr:hypothetical protein [Chthoniobacteraceae bacterium]
KVITLDFGIGGQETLNFPASPYVTSKGWITVLAGEDYTVEFDIVEGQPKNLRYVPDATVNAKPHTGRISVSLTQGKDGTILTRKAGSPKPLAMKCLTQNHGENKFRETRINPVGEVPNVDTWPNTVASVMLGDIRFAEESKEDARTPAK